MVERKAELLNKRGFAWAAILGAITIVILLWFGLTGTSAGCVGKDIPAAIAFQAARSSQDLTNIFGSSGSHCHSRIVETLRTGTKADLFLFIPIYSAFLISILMTIPKRDGRMTLFLTATLFITVSGDLTETITQLQILDNADQGSNFLGTLTTGNGAKTVGLSLFLFGIALVLWKNRTWEGGTTAVLLGLFAIVRLAGFMIEGIEQLGPLSALAAYIALALYAGFCVVTPVAKWS